MLFAEDAPEVQVLIAFLLKTMNLEVDMAENGRLACEMAEKSKAEGRPYDLIVMDIQMPEMNGYEATRWLRQRGWQGPIVALTAYAMVGDREKCLAAGCDNYLSKPVSQQGLRNILTRYIPRRDETAVARHVDPTNAAQIVSPATFRRQRARPSTNSARTSSVGCRRRRASWKKRGRQATVRHLPRRSTNSRAHRALMDFGALRGRRGG